MDKIPYSYTILRYVHDVMTQEFVNVGVVLYAPKHQIIKVKTRKTIGRIKDIFPDLDRAAFVASMRSIDRAISRIQKEAKKNPLFASDIDASSVARMALPPDDSSLQWSAIGTGLSRDLDTTLDRLYLRMIAQYNEHNERRKSDDDVWKPVREQLETRNLAFVLEEKSISGKVDDIVFKHAWKNGLWHVYEPVSLDLADADGIKEKARRWLGHLAAVTEGSEPFKAHFVIGAPSDPKLKSAYKRAIAILQCAPTQPEIFEENQIDDLVSQIEDEVRDHHSSSTT